MSTAALNLNRSRPANSRAPLRDRVVARLERATSLPVLPAAAAELMALAGQADTTAKQLSDVIHRDQVLAAHVLRVANAPSHRGVSPIVSLQQAVARLGMQLLLEIALTVSVKASLFAVKQHAALAESLWQRAYATALVSKEIARAERTNVESAFLCGLLHDVGAPVVLQAVVAETGKRAQPSPETIAALIDEFGPMIGGRLAEQWRLPLKVQVVLATYREPERAGAHRYDAALTALARATAELFLGIVEDEASVTEHPAVVELNLYDDQLRALLDTREAIEDAMKGVRA
jgi:HD-like signal output (HDOD) protein